MKHSRLFRTLLSVSLCGSVAFFGFPFVHDEGMVSRAAETFGFLSENDSSVTSKLDQEVMGVYAYNFSWDRTGGSGYLQCRADSKVSYEIISGGGFATLDGAKLTVLRQGDVIIRATAEETSVYNSASTLLMVSCNDDVFINDVGNLVLEYSGRAQPYRYKTSSGIKSCSYQYCNRLDTAAGPVWTNDAPSRLGKYLVKLDLVMLNGSRTTKYASMEIVKKELAIENFGVQSKIYDGSTETALEGNLTGVVNNESVDLQFPKIAFLSAGADTDKRIQILEGSLQISGADAGNYVLKDYDVSAMTGTVYPQVAVITVDSKYGTQGDKPQKLTYRCSPEIEDMIEPELTCRVTRKSKPGVYTIRAKEAYAENYKFSYVSGTYTVYTSNKYDSSKNDSPTDGTIQNLITPTASPVWKPQVNNSSATPDADEPVEKAGKERKFTPFSASSSIKFSGVRGNTQIHGSRIIIDRVITNDGLVSCSGTDYEIKFGKSGWTTELNVVELSKGDLNQTQLVSGASGECGVVSDVTIAVRNRLKPDLSGILVVEQYVVDREIPLIETDGVMLTDGRTSDTTKVSNEALDIQVSGLYGLTGGSILAYKLLGTGDDADVVGKGWKSIAGGHFRIAQDFEGQVAIKAIDRLGNYSMMYSERLRVDAAPPTVSGIESGNSYDGSVSYSIHDMSGVSSVTLDGITVESEGVVSKKGNHVLTAVDSNGNSVSVSFNVKKSSIFDRAVRFVQSLAG